MAEVLRPDSSMVVMEGVCAASSSGSGVGGSDPITSHAAAHRSWYDQAAASLTQAGAEAGGGSAGAAGSQSEIDAYFKAGSAANATSYFSQMQGAYSGMSSYHGESRGGR